MATIKGEELVKLRAGMFAMLIVHDLHPYMVRNVGHAWDTFHKAWKEKRVDGHALYAKYNDAHLETAFKRIFSPIGV